MVNLNNLHDRHDDLEAKIRSARASSAAHARCAKPDYDGARATEAASQAAQRKLELEVDPKGVLSPEELRRKVNHKRQQRLRAEQAKSMETRLRNRKRGAA